jgi:hypothetical protein
VRNPHRGKELARIRYDLESMRKALDAERTKRNRAEDRIEFQFCTATIAWLWKECEKLELRIHGKPKPKIKTSPHRD